MRAAYSEGGPKKHKSVGGEFEAGRREKSMVGWGEPLRAPMQINFVST